MRKVCYRFIQINYFYDSLSFSLWRSLLWLIPKGNAVVCHFWHLELPSFRHILVVPLSRHPDLPFSPDLQVPLLPPVIHGLMRCSLLQSGVDENHRNVLFDIYNDMTDRTSMIGTNSIPV